MEIRLRNSDKVALVDDADAELLAPLDRWRFMQQNGPEYTGYAVARQKNAEGKRSTIYMHRLILGAGPGEICDHINGDGLDNRRANLRICTHSENMRNRRGNRAAAVLYKGVRPAPTRAGVVRYTAILAGKYLGTFATPEEAARAYDVVARVEHGAFAKLNFPDEHLKEIPLTTCTSVARSGYIGVYKYGKLKRFQARVGDLVVGLFDSAEEAAKARDEKAWELQGRRARLNFPRENPMAQNSTTV